MIRCEDGIFADPHGIEYQPMSIPDEDDRDEEDEDDNEFDDEDSDDDDDED